MASSKSLKLHRSLTALLLLLFSSTLEVVHASASAPTRDEQVKETGGETVKKPLQYRFNHKTIIIPHDDKKFRGGEDAASTSDAMLVVADGVGGWANKGVNPGLYSRKLTQTITQSYGTLTKEEQDSVDLPQLIHDANHVAAEAHLGSATCTVVRLKDAQTLETVNIGDSGYSIHRQDPEKDDPFEFKVVYQSIPGQKGFNFPYQLGGQYGDQVHDKGVTDGPNHHTLEDQDVIVVVSDGVGDNIDPSDYHDCIQKFLWVDDLVWPTKTDFDLHHPGYFKNGELISKSAVADCIARLAYHLGKDETHHSPFAKSAESYGKKFLGGKHDDITVVVAQVEVCTEEPCFKEKKVDPYKRDSIFVYTNNHGDVPDAHDIYTVDQILLEIGGDGVEEILPEGEL